MENLNPNNPPTKNTEVTIDHWEYTDPVGVPHPDSVDFVAELRNVGPDPAQDLRALFTSAWKIGKLGAKESAVWGEAAAVKTIDGITLAPGGSRDLRVPVELATLQNKLHAEDRWPFVLKITMEIRKAGVTEPLLRREVEFPIQPGN